MKKTPALLMFASALVLLAAGCSSKLDPSQISQVGLYVDPEGSQPADSYGWRDIFYLIVDLNDVPPDTVVQASWIAVETSRLRPDTVIKIESKDARSSRLVFKLENAGNFWPTGQYQVNLYLNELLYQEIPFVVHDADVY